VGASANAAGRTDMTKPVVTFFLQICERA